MLHKNSELIILILWTYLDKIQKTYLDKIKKHPN